MASNKVLNEAHPDSRRYSMYVLMNKIENAHALVLASNCVKNIPCGFMCSRDYLRLGTMQQSTAHHFTILIIPF